MNDILTMEEIDEMEIWWDRFMLYWENKKSFDPKAQAWFENLRIAMHFHYPYR